MDARPAHGVRIDPERLIALKALAASATLSGQRPVTAAMGQRAARRPGRGTDIEDVRPWMFGDDARHIDRNVTARTGAAHVRRFHDETETTVLLVLDLRPSMLFGTRRAFRSVAAAEALALCGWRAAVRGAKVGLAITRRGDPVVLPARGDPAAMPGIAMCMARINDAELDRPFAADSALDQSVETIARHAPRDGHTIVASAFETVGPGFASGLRELRRRGRVTLIEVVDALAAARLGGVRRFATLSGRRGAASERASEPIVSRLIGLDATDVERFAIDASGDPDTTFRSLGGGHGG